MMDNHPEILSSDIKAFESNNHQMLKRELLLALKDKFKNDYRY